MKIEIGTKLTAIDPCCMEEDGRETLVVGKEYEVINLYCKNRRYISDPHDKEYYNEVVSFEIVDEYGSQHYFDIDDHRFFKEIRLLYIGKLLNQLKEFAVKVNLDGDLIRLEGGVTICMLDKNKNVYGILD